MALPHHIGIIVDGNRRWAKSHNLPTMEGHRRGYERVKECARWIFRRGIPWVSVYAFSTENWKRAEDEVRYLFQILELGLRNDTRELIEDGIRLYFVGDRAKLSPALQTLMHDAEEKTKQGTKGNFVVALNYGGRQDILNAIHALAESEKNLRNISEVEFKQALSTRLVPDVDLVIRTSGEQRISNFLLWESAYAELYFTPILFPDFKEKDLEEALAWYEDRDRRFGGNGKNREKCNI